MMHRLYCASESCKCIDGVFATLAVPIYQRTKVSYRIRSLHLFTSSAHVIRGGPTAQFDILYISAIFVCGFQ